MNKSVTEFTGIVLKLIEYKDYDTIIKVLKSDGVIESLYARGLRRPKSKLASFISLTNICQFEISKKPGISLLKGAVLLKQYRNLYQDYDKLIVASFFTELVCEHQELLPKLNLFPMLSSYLEYLEGDLGISLITASFLANILKLNGIGFQVDECTYCGCKKVSSINLDAGGFLCLDCHHQQDSVAELKLFRVINKCPYQKLELIQEVCSDNLLKLFIEFYSLNSGGNLKSLKLLNSVFSI